MWSTELATGGVLAGESCLGAPMDGSVPGTDAFSTLTQLSIARNFLATFNIRTGGSEVLNSSLSRLDITY